MFKNLIKVLKDKRGFAKVTGPLFSIEARGKLADALVYFPWKGMNVVREWRIPANPQSADQGNRRVMLGGLGRSVKYIQADSDFHTYALAVTGNGQTWVSKYVQYTMEQDFNSVANFDAHYDLYFAHPSKAHFISYGSGLGLIDYDLGYRDMDHAFMKGHMMYTLANYGCDQYLLDNTKFNVAPYTKVIADWVEADIILMVADFS